MVIFSETSSTGAPRLSLDLRVCPRVCPDVPYITYDRLNLVEKTSVKYRFPDIPWQQPIRLRNRIVHGYWSIDLEVLHTTATEQLPAFMADLHTVLDSITGSA
jgi:hypothetical protein